MCSCPIKDTEAGYLIELVRIQVVTRRGVKKATQNKNPLAKEVVPNLINLIFNS